MNFSPSSCTSFHNIPLQGARIYRDNIHFSFVNNLPIQKFSFEFTFFSGQEESQYEDEDHLATVLDKVEKKRLQLKMEEEELDRHIKYIIHDQQNVRASPVNQSFAYVTRDDLVEAFGDTVILTVQNYDKYETPLLQIVSPNLQEGINSPPK